MENHSPKEMLLRLEQGIMDLTSSQNWQQFLRAQSIFRQYSYRNVLLITQQCPSATQVAGYRAWNQLGRRVRSGERAIWILAPRVCRKKSGEEQQIEGFVSVPVFDLSQTQGSDLPEICRRLCSNAGAQALDQLARAGVALGFSVVFGELAGGVNGECHFATRELRIERRNDTAQQVKSLAHELVHAILHEGTVNRVQAELEAESGAYIICQHLGIDSGDYTFGYLASWAGNSAQALSAIQASCSVIERAVLTVLTLVEGDS